MPSDQQKMAYTGRPTFRLEGKRAQEPGWNTLEPHTDKIVGNYGVQLQAYDLVIDIDVRNGGLDSIEKIKQDTGIDIIELKKLAPITISGRLDGGCHIWLLKPEEVKIRKQIKNFPGIDFLSKGAYVVGPGSVHPNTMAPYEMEGVFPHKKFMPPVPDGLLAFISKQEFKPVKFEGHLSEEAILHAKEKFRSFLDKEPGACEGHQGDETTFRIAAMGRDLGLSSEDTLELMHRWNRKCIPPWSDTELAVKVQNAYKYCQNDPGIKNVVAALTPSGLTLKEEAEKAIKIAAKRKEKIVAELRTRSAVNFAPPVDDILYHEKDEPGNCRLFVSKKYLSDGGKSGVLFSNNTWWAWNGRLWEQMSEGDIKLDVQLEFEAFYQTQQKIDNIFRGLKSLLHSNMKSDPDLIVFANGSLDLKRGDFRPNRLTDYQKYSVAYDYDPMAECPVFKKFLYDVFQATPETEELITILQEWMGYLLVRDNSMQKIGMFVGVSRSGKGTLSTVIREMLGLEESPGTSLEHLASSHGMQHLYDRKVAIIGDAQKLKHHSTDAAKEILLNISGCDNITVNPKHARPFSVTPTCRLMLLANEMPIITDTAGALANRALVWRFNKTFAGKEDFNLPLKLRAELPGIFNWAMEGFFRLKRNGKFSIPDSMTEEIRTMRRINNPLGAFCDDIMRYDPDKSIIAEEIYRNEYTAYCTGYGRRPMTKDRFTSAMIMHLRTWYGQNDPDNLNTISQTTVHVHGAPRTEITGITLRESGAFSNLTGLENKKSGGQ